MNSGQRTIVLDLRCLQDPNLADRGVGRHALAILLNAPRSLRLVGLTDPNLPAIVPEACDAAHVININAYCASTSGLPLFPPRCFIMMSPMTHDPIFVARLLSDPTLLRAAVVHDFIPRRHPDQYLPGLPERLNYAVALRWLARCNLFLPNSRNTADHLRTLLKVPDRAIVVTGCALPPAFKEMPTITQDVTPRHLLVVGGPDPRKNPEVAIRAHARSSVMQSGVGIPLVLAGRYAEADARAFRAVAVAAGGRADLIQVPGYMPDVALLDLYSRAHALISPSRDEGFSIPVIEGMAVGVACLVSDIPAHAELVVDPDCRFPADDDVALRPLLERVVADAEWRATIVMRQANVLPRFTASAVATRFWDAILKRLEMRAPVVLRSKPRVAMLSPLPPDRSGVADYTAATCAELGKLVDLHVFTEAPNPSPLSNVSSIRPLAALPHVSAGFDRVISVIGNSHFHVRIFEMLLRYGGACIAHDARMIGFYRNLIGRQRALAIAGKELGRTVTDAELDGWEHDEGKLKALFLGEIAASAAPTIVHSPVTARLLQTRYGVTSACLPFSIYRPWQPEELTPARRQAARARLGIAPGECAIVTFGFVHYTKAPEECVWALKLMRGWGIPASLHFAGAFQPNERTANLRPLVAKLDLEPYVRFTPDYVSEQTYRDYLVGANLAVQLRTLGLGSLSGAVLDCAAAGLPTVTNQALGMAVGVPDYFRSVPDALSPLLVAEALAEMLDAGSTTRLEAARRAYSEERSFASYAQRLCRTLALEAPQPSPQADFVES